MSIDKRNKVGLLGWIERSLDGGTHTFSKKLIKEFSRDDLSTARECLQQWASEGKLEILKPLDEAADDEPVVKMKAYIEGKSPWPNWPPQD
jgi:hypothetical protein